MRYCFKNDEIHNKAEWKRSFCAAYNSDGDDIPWKEGRSGERLAEDFVGAKPNGEFTMKDMVKRFLKTDDITLDIAKIEHASVFDEFPRPRRQDLAIWGKVQGKDLFIGVEAKVDESFGSTTIKAQRNYVNKLKKEGVSTQADQRLDKLIRDFLSGDEESNGGLRYQLLYYLAGSVREHDSEMIFMPVIVYKSDLYNDNKGKHNRDAYKAFMEKLGFSFRPEVVDKNFELAYYKRLNVDGVYKDVYSCYIVK